MKKTAKKIYTRTGDSKTTGLLGGIRISKHSARIEAIGSLDELNSSLGFVLSLSENILKNNPNKKAYRPFKKIIEQIQQDLFVVGTDLSHPIIFSNSIPHPLSRHLHHTFVEEKRRLPKIVPEHIHQLEDWIDHFQAKLPALKNFILPQGNAIGSFLQFARALCRRTERRTVQLATHAKINPLILAYLNRLSDLLFVLARAVNYKGKKSEVLWSAKL